MLATSPKLLSLGVYAANYTGFWSRLPNVGCPQLLIFSKPDIAGVRIPGQINGRSLSVLPSMPARFAKTAERWRACAREPTRQEAVANWGS
jgi:hypothetical protein